MGSKLAPGEKGSFFWWLFLQDEKKLNKSQSI